MATKIEWVKNKDGSQGDTWNPLRGTVGKWHCTKVSEGCANCYAERLNVRFAGPAYVVGADTMRLDQKILEQPLRWRKPRMVFVCSMTDIFHEDVTDEMLDEMFAVMFLADHHTFQVLTKRSKRMREYFTDPYRWAMIEGNAQRIHNRRTGRDPSEWMAVHSLPNVWLGVSVENQERADERIPDLIGTPAYYKFLSVEPLLGPVKLNLEEKVGRQYIKDHIDWVIVGGESGPGARPMHPEWARSLRDECAGFEPVVSFFFKQWGAWAPEEISTDGISASVMYLGDPNQISFGGGVPNAYMHRIGKKKAGRLLDGITHDEMPMEVKNVFSS